MKILGPANESDLPDALLDALHAAPADVAYCMTCDGLRLRDHDCIDPYLALEGKTT